MIMTRVKVSFAPSIRRLPSYLIIIRQALQNGESYISGTVIAQELNLEPIQVRKDLAITGIIGKPKKGYPVAALVAAIEHFLGWDKVHKAVVVGAGNLGFALAGYREFKLHGLEVIATFDIDRDKLGAIVHGVPVLPLEDLSAFVRDNGVEVAILTVPGPVAQDAADRLVEGDIKAIWNFTDHKLDTPSGVVVHREDLSSGYALLSVMIRNQRGREA